MIIRGVIPTKSIMHDLIHEPAIDAFIEMRWLDAQQEKTQERCQPQD